MLGKVISSGSEGTIYLQPDGKALKVYIPPHHYNREILPLVQKVNNTKGTSGFLIDVYDYGTKNIQGRESDYELMQYCPSGPASSRKELRGNADIIWRIAYMTAKALDACHKAGFIHKDVKPANILLVDENYRSVLCDFGIADLLKDGESITLQNRTKIYAAPEMYDPSNIRHVPGMGECCRLTPAADFYSLGMTIISMWLGESALITIPEKELAFRKNEGFKVPDNMPEPLRTVTQGLLVPEPDDRWGMDQIERTRKGEKVKIERRMKIVYSSEKKQTAHSLEELAAFMVEDPELAKRYIYTEKLDEWLNQKPELQAIIKEIEKNTQKKEDHDFGFLQIIHTLNPLYDLGLKLPNPNLPKGTPDPDYAMYDKGIGEMLNKAYYLYFTKYECNYKLMTQKWDKDDAALISNPVAAYHIAHSFEVSGNQDYLNWFLSAKNNLFKGSLTQQINFYQRMKKDEDRNKKNGYKDKSYISQVKMMRTIAGFNALPTFRFPGTDTKLKSIDDFNKASSSKLEDALRNDLGIRGWLAVMYQENPNAKPGRKEEHKYDVLLEQFVQALGKCDSDNREYQRFISAQKDTKEVASNAKSQIRKVYTASTIQKIIAATLAFIPAVVLLISIVLNALDNPVLNMDAIKNNWVFYGLGGVFTIAAYFLFFEGGGGGGCLLSVIIGVVASTIIILLLKFLGQYLLWIYAAVVFIVIILFLFVSLFKKSAFAMKVKSILKPGFGDLVLAPLDFAFNNDSTFTPNNSGLNGSDLSTWKDDVKDRWKTVIIFILIIWGLIACSTLLPKSNRMSHFNRQMKHSAATLFSNDSIPVEEEEIKPELQGDGTTVPFVKPKERGIIRQ